MIKTLNLSYLPLTFNCSIKNWEENEYLRPRAEEEDKFKLMHLSCYARVYKEDEFNWIMNPLCQANNLGS